LVALGPHIGEAMLDENERVAEALEALTMEELRQLLAEVEERLRGNNAESSRRLLGAGVNRSVRSDTVVD
jgi:hypothetical protein